MVRHSWGRMLCRLDGPPEQIHTWGVGNGIVSATHGHSHLQDATERRMLMGRTIRRAHVKKDGTPVRATVVRTPASLSLPESVRKSAKAAAAEANDAVEPEENPRPVESQPEEVRPEEIQSAVDEVIIIPAQTDVSLSPSAWREAIRAGHKTTGCECGVDESDFDAPMNSGQLEAVHRCVGKNVSRPSMLMTALHEGRADIETLTDLQERLSQEERSEDQGGDMDRLVAYMSAQEALMWRDGSGDEHFLYGSALSARRVKYATRAVKSALRK